MAKPAKNTICLWYDGDAEEAARFYAKTFPDSSVGAVHLAPGDFPSGKKGDVLTVEFTVMGIPCIGLNGGPAFKHNEAFSFQVATADQAETDRYWNAIVGNGGEESACGWCKDKWGLSWQITPIALTKAITDPDPAVAKRAFDAMMTMKKIDIAAIEAAPRLRLHSLASSAMSSRCDRQPGYISGGYHVHADRWRRRGDWTANRSATLALMADGAVVQSNVLLFPRCPRRLQDFSVALDTRQCPGGWQEPRREHHHSNTNEQYGKTLAVDNVRSTSPPYLNRVCWLCWRRPACWHARQR